MKKNLAAIVIAVAIMTGFTVFSFSANEKSKHDGSGNQQGWSTLGVDSATKAETRLLLIDGSGGLIVSGLAAAACDYSSSEIKKTSVSATATGTIAASAASTVALVCNESLDDIYWGSRSTTVSADTGMRMWAGDCFTVMADSISNVYFYNGTASAATVSVFFCP